MGWQLEENPNSRVDVRGLGHRSAGGSRESRDESQSMSRARGVLIESRGLEARGRQGAVGSGPINVQGPTSRVLSKASLKGATVV